MSRQELEKRKGEKTLVEARLRRPQELDLLPPPSPFRLHSIRSMEETEPKNEHPHEIPNGTGPEATPIDPPIEPEPAAAESPIEPEPTPAQSPVETEPSPAIEPEETPSGPPMELAESEVKAVGVSNGDEVDKEKEERSDQVRGGSVTGEVSRTFTMRELLNELKEEEKEANAGGRSGSVKDNGGETGAEITEDRSSLRFVLFCFCFFEENICSFKS